MLSLELLVPIDVGTNQQGVRHKKNIVTTNNNNDDVRCKKNRG
jgi:hypothetical protein